MFVDAGKLVLQVVWWRELVLCRDRNDEGHGKLPKELANAVVMKARGTRVHMTFVRLPDKN